MITSESNHNHVKVAIIDYGMGNLDSVKRAAEESGGIALITNKKKDITDATHIILPGDGAFPDGMKNIKENNLDKTLEDQVIKKGVPLLGLCLGMQILADKGFEGDETEGLGWIQGEVKRMEPVDPKERIPHIGWNEVDFVQDSPLFSDITSGKDFYFIHSFKFICQDKSDILAATAYCGKFTSIVGKRNIFGVQFHPEKSQKSGLQLLKNFLSF